MIEALKSEKVLVKRTQDIEPWAGRTIANVFYSKFNSEGEVIGKGDYIATEIEDDRGYRVYALMGQMRPE